MPVSKTWIDCEPSNFIINLTQTHRIIFFLKATIVFFCWTSFRFRNFSRSTVAATLGGLRLEVAQAKRELFPGSVRFSQQRSRSRCWATGCFCFGWGCFFTSRNRMKQLFWEILVELHSLKLAVSTWKWMVGILLSFGKAYFQGLC